MNAILCEIGRFRGVLLLFGVVGVLSSCCGCTPAIGEQPWLARTTTSGARTGTTTSPFLQEDALAQAEDPFAETPPPEPDPALLMDCDEGRKYCELLRKIDVEKDRGSYGAFYDYGYYTGTSYYGYKDLPRGYWVYVAPNWYIYAEAKGVKPPQNPPKLARKKYGTLLRKFKVEQDANSYGEYYDYGYYTATSHSGYKDLPPGYWVYVAPYWYIFGEVNPLPVSSIPKPVTPKRSWGPEQATGAPDTPRAGDIRTAWASKSSGGQNEWLRLYYAKPVIPAAVHVYETYNPGALYRITARKPNGQEVEIWAGKDPVAVGSGMGRAAIGIEADFPTNRITIYLKSNEVSGWNEIDAVGLMDPAEKIQWAVAAQASSTWASPGPQHVPITPQSNHQRIEHLEAQVKQMQYEIRQLRQKDP